MAHFVQTVALWGYYSEKGRVRQVSHLTPNWANINPKIRSIILMEVHQGGNYMHRPFDLLSK